MEVLKIRPILDNVLKYLYADDFLNLLVTLNLEKEYACRALKIANVNKCFDITMSILVNHTIKYVDKQTIRDNFNAVWNVVEFHKFNDKFFIDNYDLISHKKLRQLRKTYTIFDYDDRDFSEEFHKTFPDFNGLKLCVVHDCLNVVEKYGETCPKCDQNTCPRCHCVVLPKLELNRFGECEGCAGCAEFEDEY